MTLDDEYAKRTILDLDHINDRLHIFYAYFADAGSANLASEISSIHCELSHMADAMRKLFIEEDNNV